MFESAVFRNQDQGTAEEKLWRAVIAKTLEEWVRGPLRYSRKAEEFLFHDERDFQAVCSSAGLDARTFREKLHSTRTRVVANVKRHIGETGTKPSHHRMAKSFS